MVYGISPDPDKRVSKRNLLGTWNPLSDIGALQLPRTDIGLDDYIDTGIKRKPITGYPEPSGQRPDIPNRTTIPKPDDIDTIRRKGWPFGWPWGRPPPPPWWPITAPVPMRETRHRTEALRAKDSIFVKKQERRPDKPFIIAPYSGTTQLYFRVQRPYGLTSGPKYAKSLTAVRGYGNRYYDRYTRKKLPACKVLKNQMFDIENRKHRKSGKSDARLRQIRRTYAYRNCK